MELTKKESLIAFIVSMIFIGGVAFFYFTEANKCAAKDGRYIFGGKYDYPVCVKEIK
jgi:hypothetical protein